MSLKRKRAASFAACDAAPAPSITVSLPLTAVNLACFDRILAPPKTSKSTSPSKVALDDGTKLAAYKIEMPTPLKIDELTPELAALISDIQKERTANASPHAARAMRVAGAAQKMPEDDGIAALARNLYLQPDIWDGDDELIHVSVNHNLVQGFLPPISSRMAKFVGALERPRPDICYGYLLSRLATPLQVTAPFTVEEEILVEVKKLNVSKQVAFPFLTVQWKAAQNGGTHNHAQLQSARDAAAIVNANYWLYTLEDAAASPLSASTCHFSSTCDMHTAILYIHYRSDALPASPSPTYRTHILLETILSDTQQMAIFRRHIRNIYDWAVGTRLKSIKAAIALLWDTPGSTTGPGRDDGSTEVADETASQTTGRDTQSNPFGFLAGAGVPALTPSLTSNSAADEEERRGRLKKRKLGSVMSAQ